MSYTYLPISVSVKNRECLVVGAGTVALHKVEILSAYDTRITVVAPEVHPQIEHLAKEKKITLEKREYRTPEAAAEASASRRSIPANPAAASSMSPGPQGIRL